MTQTTHRTREPATALAGRREKERDARARKRRFRVAWQVSLAVLAAAIVLGAIFWAVLRPQPGTLIPSLGNAHVDPSQVGKNAYNSTPPTSGPHLPTLASWGVHDQPLSNEQQVHNLEDGGVLVQYNCPEGCSELVSQLLAVVARYRDQVILAPYPGMNTRIALTAWQRIDPFDQFDEKRIVRFIRAYRGLDHHVGAE
jgi:hypothetical protein